MRLGRTSRDVWMKVVRGVWFRKCLRKLVGRRRARWLGVDVMTSRDDCCNHHFRQGVPILHVTHFDLLASCLRVTRCRKTCAESRMTCATQGMLGWHVTAHPCVCWGSSCEFEDARPQPLTFRFRLKCPRPAAFVLVCSVWLPDRTNSSPDLAVLMKNCGCKGWG